MKTLKNAIIGVVITTVFYFIPILNIIAPLLGAGVGGYLQKEGPVPGAKVGGVMGIIMLVPAFFLAGILSWMFSFLGDAGAFLAGSTILITLLITAWSIVVGGVGGAIGGAVAGNTAHESQPAPAQN